MSFLPTLFKKFQRDNALFLARGLAFDVVVCMIPAVIVLILVFGYLFDSPRETFRFLTPYLKPVIPFSQQYVLRGLFSAVKTKKVLGLVGIIGLLWTLSRVFGSIRTVLDQVFQVKEGRGIIGGKLFDLKMMFLSSLFFLGTVLITSFFSVLKKVGGYIPGLKFLLGVYGEIISIPLAFIFTAAMFFCIYKFIPYRRIQTETALFSALGASILWEVAKHTFRLYLLKAADLTQIYGSFGLLFALIFWIYYSCIVFILAAEMGWVWQNKKG